MSMRNESLPAAYRLIAGGVFCVALIAAHPDFQGSVVSGWALRGSLLRGGLAAITIAVLYPVLAHGGWVQRVLAVLLLVMPAFELFIAFLIAANKL
jgi:hypothetical protein